MAKIYKKIAAISMAAVLLAGASVTWAASTNASQPSNNNGTSTTNNAGAAAQPALSKDNSLKSLSLSEGELSPAFQSSTVNYTATVGADTTSVEVDAQLSNSHATIDGIAGNTDLQPGENKITITVTSQAGTKAVYTITVTRSEAGAEAPVDGETAGGTETDGEAAGGEAGEAAAGTDMAVINSDGTVTVNGTIYQVSENYLSDSAPDGQVYSENTYDALQKQYQTLKKRSIMIFAAMVVLICILIFLLVNIRIKHRFDDEEDIDPDEMFTDVPKRSSRSKRPKRASVWGSEEEEEDYLDDWPSEPLPEHGILEPERKIKEARGAEKRAEKRMIEARETEKRNVEVRKEETRTIEEEEEVKVPSHTVKDTTDPEMEIMDLNDL